MFQVRIYYFDYYDLNEPQAREWIHDYDFLNRLDGVDQDGEQMHSLALSRLSIGSHFLHQNSVTKFQLNLNVVYFSVSWNLSSNT